VLIREAARADIPAMMAIASHAATAAQWPREQYEQLFVPHAVERVALVLEEGALLAFLIARGSGEEWELENIAVSGPARRRGLGSRLLGEFIDRIRGQGARSVFLEVRESNHAARTLYEKWAFTEAGRRQNYYRDPAEDAVVYRLLFS
jgi:[ribosomal protein S18]-alanine N-acetyltransferase